MQITNSQTPRSVLNAAMTLVNFCFLYTRNALYATAIVFVVVPLTMMEIYLHEGPELEFGPVGYVVTLMEKAPLLFGDHINTTEEGDTHIREEGLYGIALVLILIYTVVAQLISLIYRRARGIRIHASPNDIKKRLKISLSIVTALYVVGVISMAAVGEDVMGIIVVNLFFWIICVGSTVLGTVVDYIRSNLLFVSLTQN